MEQGFQIANLRVQLRAPAEAFAAALFDAWAGFTSSALPHCTIEVRLTPGTASSDPRPMPEVERSADGALRIWGLDFEAIASPDRRQVRIDQRRERYPLDSVVKILLAEALLAQGGLLVHGVAVEAGERAALFTGPSGAGKSTLGSLCHAAGLTRLADELVAVIFESGGYWACGTPWNVGSPGRARLTALGTLAWSAEHRLAPAVPAALLRVLLPNAVMPDPSPAGRGRMFRVASELLKAVTPVELSFAPAAGVAEVLRACLVHP